MAKEIYLEGGGATLKEETIHIDRAAMQKAKKKSVYVLDLTGRDEEKIATYREFFKEYFKKIGGEEINFASVSTVNEIKKGVQEAGVLYIPGGDTELLIENVKEKGLTESIKSFKGVIIGMSAGAYLMCSQYTKIREDKIDLINALGVLDFNMQAHYEEKFDPQLIELSKEKDIYAVTDKSAIMVNEKRKPSFIGEVYLFSKGNKTKVN